MEQIIDDVTTRLALKVPALKYIDEDWGQLDFYQPHPPVKWPCALVDVVSATWTNSGHLQQLGLLQVKVRIADLRLSNSSQRAPLTQKVAADSIFVLLRNVYIALHGFTGGQNYSALIRTNNSRIRREDGVRIYEITFTTEMKDNSAMPVIAKAPKPTARLAVQKAV
jgi:hypothetical protein